MKPQKCAISTFGCMMIVPENIRAHIEALSEDDAKTDLLVSGQNRVEEYISRIEHEFAVLAPHLEPPLESVLDIGCGLAGLSALIAREFDAKSVTLWDGAGEASNRKVGYHADTQAWADVELGRAMVKANSGAWVSTEPVGAPYDLVLSSRAWGLHFPLETYLPYVAWHLGPKGAVIVDIRHGDIERAKDEMAAYGLGFTDTIDSYRKSQRLKFVRAHSR